MTRQFADHGPSDAPPLPLNYGDREDLKHGGIDHVVALYARSLMANEYDVEAHPSFDDCACGVMASGLFSWGDASLASRYPPRPLEGLDIGLCWRTPEDRPVYDALCNRFH